MKTHKIEVETNEGKVNLVLDLPDDYTKQQILQNIFDKLDKDKMDIPEEFIKVINEDFWELL